MSNLVTLYTVPGGGRSEERTLSAAAPAGA